jgi:hypothetical protein
MSDHLRVADRVGDAERDRVVRELTRHCGDGRLTLDELEDRVAQAYEATTIDDLALLLHDLPTSPDVLRGPEPAAPPPVRPPAPPSAPSRQPTARTREIERDREREKALGALFTIGGFVLLFNGLFWLALICWFVLPGLLIHGRRGR